MNETGKTPLWTKNFCVLILIMFSNSFCFQMLNSTLALYVESIVGADSGRSGSISGLASLVFTIAIMAARLVSGDLLERWGRRPVVTLGAVILAAGCLVNAFVPTVTALIVLRAIQGIGAGSASTGISLGTVHVVPPERLTEGVGKSGMGGTVAMIAGPGIALALVSGGDFRIPFYTVAMCCAVTIAGTWIIRTGRDEEIARRRRKQKEGVRPDEEGRFRLAGLLSRLVEREVLLPSLIQMLVMISFASYTTFLTIFAARRGFANAGYFFAVSSVVMVITQFATGRLGDKYGPVPIAIPGMGLAVAAFIGVVLAPTELVFLACGVFYGVGSGLIMPVLSAFAIKGVPEEKKSSANATFYVFYDGGLGLGALLWGMVVDLLGIEAMYVGAAVTMALAGGMTYYVFGIRRWPEKRGVRS